MHPCLDPLEQVLGTEQHRHQMLLRRESQQSRRLHALYVVAVGREQRLLQMTWRWQAGEKTTEGGEGRHLPSWGFQKTEGAAKTWSIQTKKYLWRSKWGRRGHQDQGLPHELPLR